MVGIRGMMREMGLRKEDWKDRENRQPKIIGQI